MTDAKMLIELAKLDGRDFTKKKTEQGHRLLPCPKCNSHNLTISDCGYSSFNCGDVKCKCGYKFDCGSTLGCNPANDQAAMWNHHCKSSLPDYLNSRDAIIPLIEKRTDALGILARCSLFDSPRLLCEELLEAAGVKL